MISVRSTSSCTARAAPIEPPHDLVPASHVNINSVRASHGTKISREEAPDILCLQETVECGIFPKDMFQSLGYEQHHHGQRMHHGVAIRHSVGRRANMTGRRMARRATSASPAVGRLDNAHIPAGGDIPDANQTPPGRRIWPDDRMVGALNGTRC